MFFEAVDMHGIQRQRGLEIENLKPGKYSLKLLRIYHMYINIHIYVYIFHTYMYIHVYMGYNVNVNTYLTSLDSLYH